MSIQEKVYIISSLVNFMVAMCAAGYSGDSDFVAAAFIGLLLGPLITFSTLCYGLGRILRECI